jgi:hypothetical protein
VEYVRGVGARGLRVAARLPSLGTSRRCLVVDPRRAADGVEPDSRQLVGPVLGFEQMMPAGVIHGGQDGAGDLLVDGTTLATWPRRPLSSRGGSPTFAWGQEAPDTVWSGPPSAFRSYKASPSRLMTAAMWCART